MIYGIRVVRMNDIINFTKNQLQRHFSKTIAILVIHTKRHNSDKMTLIYIYILKTKMCKTMYLNVHSLQRVYDRIQKDSVNLTKQRKETNFSLVKQVLIIFLNKIISLRMRIFL